MNQTLIKRCRLTVQTEKNTLDNHMLSRRDSHQIQRYKDTNQLKIKGWGKMYYENSNQRVAILISDKMNLKTKIVTRKKRKFYNNKRVNSAGRDNNL